MAALHNRGTVFSTWPIQRQKQTAQAEWLFFRFPGDCCGCDTATDQEPRGVEHTLLEAFTIGLLKTEQTKKASCVL